MDFKDVLKLLPLEDYLPKETVAMLYSMTFSKLLGTGIVVGGSLVKLPQVIKILLSGSAKGISLQSYLLETLAYSVTLAYNYRNQNPFSTYGETFFIAIQNCIIMLLIMTYSRKGLGMLVLTALLAGSNWALFQPSIVNEQNLMYLQVLTIPISILSKVPQILANFSNGSTGQLSALTVFAFFAGSLARVYTTWKDVHDDVILWGFGLATVLNAVLALQMVWYWRSSDAKKKPNYKRRKND